MRQNDAGAITSFSTTSPCFPKPPKTDIGWGLCHEKSVYTYAICTWNSLRSSIYFCSLLCFQRSMGFIFHGPVGSGLNPEAINSYIPLLSRKIRSCKQVEGAGNSHNFIVFINSSYFGFTFLVPEEVKPFLFNCSHCIKT